MTGPRRILATIVVLASLAGCGASPGSAASPSATADSSVAEDDLRFSCGRFPFGAEIMTAPARHDEDALNPAADALRRHLALGGPDIDFLPDEGWTLAGMDAGLAEFVTVGGALGMKSVSVENKGGGWKVSGWGDCRPTIVLADGLGAAEWAWGGPGDPGPETRTFDALVTEMMCASGRSSEGRIVGPVIVPSAETVLVMFAVRSLGGGTCPSNPSTRVTVDLGEPLGDRQLLDGGRLPFGDPTKPRF